MMKNHQGGLRYLGPIDEHRKEVTVVEILDSNRFIAAWRSSFYEARALPSTGFFSVGDQVVCHVLPGNTELVATFVQQEIIYFSPGGLWPGAWANWHGELWKYDGVNPPTHVWTPSTLLYEHPTCLSWYAGTSRLYIWTWGYHTVTGDAHHRIYELDPSDDSVSLVLDHNQTTDGNWQDPGMDVAQFTYAGADYLFVHHGWWSGFGDSRIIRFDPATGTEVTVFVYPQGGGANVFCGGICLHEGSGRLLGFSGYQMYRSLDGLVWVLDKDMSADWGLHDAGPMVYNPDDDLVYVVYPWDNIANQGGVASYNGAAWVREYNYAPVGSNVGFKGIGNLYSSAITEAVIGYWNWFAALTTPSVHKRTGGVWGIDWPGPTDYYHTACQTMVTLNNELLTLLYHALVPYDVRLYARDVTGAYAVLQNWANYRCWETHAYTQCMTLARTSKLIHEI